MSDTSGLLKSVFEAMVEGVVVQRADGSIVFANAAAERILGLPLDQLTGRTSVDPRWRAEHEDGSPFPGSEHPAMKALATGTSVRQVLMSVHKPDGTRALLEVNAEPVFESGASAPAHVVATFVDVSERRANEDHVRVLAQTVSDLYNQAPCGYHSLDRNGLYTQINDTEVEWLGVPRESLLGKRSPTEFMTPESRARVERRFPMFMELGVVAEMELEFLRPGGGIRTVSLSATAIRNAAGEYVASRTVLYDISELVRLRTELVHQHEREQQVMLENELVAVARLRDRVFVWANGAMGRLFGYEPAQMVGLSVEALHSGGTATLPSGEPMYVGSRQRTQAEMKRSDGAHLWVDVYEAPVGDSGDVIALYADLTPIREAQSRRLAGQRMESVGRLAGGVAHEFNNKLQTILGGAELALMEVPDGSSLQRDLLHIQAAARHAAAITQQLMAYARKQPSTPTTMNLADAVAAALALVAPSVPATIHVTTTLSVDTWPVLMDQGQFTDVMTALMLNACEAIEGTGHIAVETRNVHVDTVGSDTFPDARPGDFVAVSVRDSGRGMTPEVAARAFEPFFTTKRFGTNSGLGLSTVYGTIAQHKGWVRIVSAPTQGCEVTMFIPRQAAGAGPDSRTVLLVEDDAGVQMIAKAMLRRLGFDALVASTAEDGAALFRASATPVGLLLSDVVLPGMSGVELADALREEHPDLGVVLMSAYSAEALADRDPHMERFVLLPKPFTLDALADALARTRH